MSYYMTKKIIALEAVAKDALLTLIRAKVVGESVEEQLTDVVDALVNLGTAERQRGERLADTLDYLFTQYAAGGPVTPLTHVPELPTKEDWVDAQDELYCAED